MPHCANTTTLRSLPRRPSEMRVQRGLVEEAIEEDDVGITLADGGEDEFVVTGPGDTASDKGAMLAEVGGGMHRAVGGGEEPEVGAELVVQSKCQPLAVMGEDGMQTLPGGNAVSGDGCKEARRSGLRAGRANLVIPETIHRFQNLGVIESGTIGGDRRAVGDFRADFNGWRARGGPFHDADRRSPGGAGKVDVVGPATVGGPREPRGLWNEFVVVAAVGAHGPVGRSGTAASGNLPRVG